MVTMMIVCSSSDDTGRGDDKGGNTHHPGTQLGQWQKLWDNPSLHNESQLFTAKYETRVP